MKDPEEFRAKTAQGWLVVEFKLAGHSGPRRGLVMPNTLLRKNFWQVSKEPLNPELLCLEVMGYGVVSADDQAFWSVNLGNATIVEPVEIWERWPELCAHTVTHYFPDYYDGDAEDEDREDDGDEDDGDEDDDPEPPDPEF